MQTIHAAVLHELGRAPRYDTLPAPRAGAGEVLIHVRAAALKQIDRLLAAGTPHPLAPKQLPAACGADGVGTLADGARVLFMSSRAPYGGMAEQTVVREGFYFLLPDGLDDVTAAALFNPGMSAWFAITWRAKLERGESVLVLGATGATGQLAVQIAKQQGAGRIVAAGRNAAVLEELRALGAEPLQLRASPEANAELLYRAAAVSGFDVVLDYLWGAPMEALLTAIRREGYPVRRTRIIQVGAMAGWKIALEAGLGNYGIEIIGNGVGSGPPRELAGAGFRELYARAAAGELRIDTRRVPLAEVEHAWSQPNDGKRIVFVPG